MKIGDEMKTFYLTDAGKVRGHNEDSVTILKNKSNEYLLMVADGMGGHRKGEVASMIAITHLGKRFTEIASIVVRPSEHSIIPSLFISTSNISICTFSVAPRARISTFFFG